MNTQSDSKGRCEPLRDGGNAGKLHVKVFNGKPREIENEITNLINTAPIKIEKVLQSESSYAMTFAVTVTIFYYTAGPAQFMDKNIELSFLANKVIDYCLEIHGVEFSELVSFIVDKQEERIKSSTIVNNR